MDVRSAFEQLGVTEDLLTGEERARLDHDAPPRADEVQLVAPKGSAVIFNSHLWHGGATNATSDKRRACHCYWAKRGLHQQLDQRAYITPKTYTRIGAAGRWLLDVGPVGSGS